MTLADVGREPGEDLTVETVGILEALKRACGQDPEVPSAQQTADTINNLCTFIISLDQFAAQMPASRSKAYHSALNALLKDAALCKALRHLIRRVSPPHARGAGSLVAVALRVLSGRGVGWVAALEAEAAALAAAAAEAEALGAGLQ